MNRKPGYGAKLRANLEPTKGVGSIKTAGRWSWKSKSAKECPAHPGIDSVGGRVQRLEEHRTSRGVRQGKSAKWIRNLGKRIGSEAGHGGSQSRTRRLSADCSSCFRGESGSPRAGRGTDWERPLRGPSPGVEQPTQNCETTAKGTGLAESAGKEDPVELDSSPTL
ncbi:hypothetical protein L6452_46119 [Arctium lappa]|nr:hypothetical protein L6452_46119 [Arctium lappa]